MRVVRVHAPGTDPRLAASIEAAVREFNGALDIRLRFLSIGIEEEVVDVGDAASAAEHVAAVLAVGAPTRRPADAMLLLGAGPAAVAAATAAARLKVAVLRVGAGRRAGANADADRATDRLCGVLLVEGETEAAALRAEAATAEIEVVGSPEDPETGRKVVRALSRARRRRPC